MPKKRDFKVKVKPKAVTKPPTVEHLLCQEAMELVKTRPYLKLRIKADGFTLQSLQQPPWGFTMKGGFTRSELNALVKRINDAPARG